MLKYFKRNLLQALQMIPMRLALCARKGCQTPRCIPPEAWAIFHRPVAIAFDRLLAK